MSTDRWETLSAWHNAWLAALPDERERLRQQLASERPDLVRDAEALIRGSRGLSAFLETPAFVLAAQELAREQALLPAQTMVGPYHIVELLARGGMGDVYRATDVRLRRDVAIKILPPNHAGDRDRYERFVQEAQLTAAIDHPNVVRVYDVGLHGSRPFLVEELLEGETLRSRITRGPMAAGEVRRVALDIAREAAAHEAGLVHRDLKPENVFLTRSGGVRILDFGIAKLAQPEAEPSQVATNTGVVIGTAGYLAPEQIRRVPVDARADLFALGSVLFEMLTGRRAFARDHAVETLHAILHEPPPDILGEHDVPPWFRAIVGRLLEKDREHRYQSADAVAVALERAETETIDPSTPQIRSGWPQAERLGGARPARARAIVAGAAILVLAAIGVRWYTQRPAPAADGQILAVFPFRSLPASADAALLELGLADVLISRLGQVAHLSVLPLSATERLQKEEPREAARRLGATQSLLGTVQRAAGGVRVNAQLRSVPDDRVLWTATLDTAHSNIFSVQDEIVARVLQEIAPELPDAARRKLRGPGTTNSDAFEAYLRGRGYSARPGNPSLHRAIELYRGAVTLDPSFADAWAALGGAYRVLPISADGVPDEAFVEARRAAERALDLDPDHAEAHEVLGSVRFWYDWDYPGAERLARRALLLQPSSVTAHRFLGHLLSNLGRHDEALAFIRRARELDPNLEIVHALEGQFLTMAGRYREALEVLDRLVEAQPRFPNGHIIRTYPLIALGRYEEAVRACDKADELIGMTQAPQYSWSLALRAYAEARTGRSADAERTLAVLQRRAAAHYVPRHHVALVLHALGRDGDALRELTAAVDARDVFVTFLGVDPKWDGLRGSPEFQAIARRVNLLEVSNRAREARMHHG